MIASFLRQADGDFDYAACVMSLTLAAGAAGIALQLRRALRTGHIWSTSPEGSSSQDRYVQREMNAVQFWMLFTIYGIGMLLMMALATGIVFGIFRRP